MTAGDQRADAIRKRGDFGRGPVQAESVHERGSESVAGPNGIDDIYRVSGRFDIMPVGEDGAAAVSQRDGYGLPPVTNGSLSAKCLARTREVPRIRALAAVPPR